MKLGLFDHMQKHDRPALSYVELYKNHLEVVECADQAGHGFLFCRRASLRHGIFGMS